MHFSNSLEPAGLVRHFLQYPPADFEPLAAHCGQPGFFADFDLLTTAEPSVVKFVAALPCAAALRRWLVWRTLFFGTTVSEYVPLPAGQESAALLAGMFEVWQRKTRLMIIKDIPYASPLLPVAESTAATALLKACKKSGFILVTGQALAYVPIDCASEDEYLSRLSSGRRKNIRRKLRVRQELRIEILASGSPRFDDAAFLATLYALYLEVYAQSEIHFDRLTPEFFEAILRDSSLDGHLFLYYHQASLIGFNLCFVYHGMLVDKYVGFSYPAAREHNLYFVSWMENLEFARRHGLSHYIAGWTDPEIKSYLGARFTFTQHAVYLRHPLLRRILGRCARFFEHDKSWFESQQS